MKSKWWLSVESGSSSSAQRQLDLGVVNVPAKLRQWHRQSHPLTRIKEASSAACAKPRELEKLLCHTGTMRNWCGSLLLDAALGHSVLQIFPLFMQLASHMHTSVPSM